MMLQPYWHTDCRLICQPPTVNDAMELLMRILGVTWRVADDELRLGRDTSLRLEWLCSSFSNINDADMDVQIKCVVRAYLLYLVVCTLFSDKSENKSFCLVC